MIYMIGFREGINREVEGFRLFDTNTMRFEYREYSEVHSQLKSGKIGIKNLRIEAIYPQDTMTHIHKNILFYNCLFRDPYNKLSKGKRHNTYIRGDQSKFIAHNYSTKFINCISIDMPIISTWSDYKCQRVHPNIELINCATNVSKLDSPNNEYGYGYNHDVLIKTTCLENINFDGDYNIIIGNWQNTGTGTNLDDTKAHIGIYGGSYAW